MYRYFDGALSNVGSERVYYLFYLTLKCMNIYINVTNVCPIKGAGSTDTQVP